MSEIRVSTDDLRNGSQILKSVAGEIESAQSQVNSVSASVGNAYDGQLKDSIERLAGGFGQTGTNLQSRAIDLGEELLSRAVGFESANELGRNAVLGASTAYINFIETTPMLGFLAFLSKLKEKALSIWSMGGFAIAGFLSLMFGSSKSEILTPFPKSLQDSTAYSGKTGFGTLLEKYEREKKDTAESIQSQLPKGPVGKYDIYYDIPVKSQGTLYGSAACLPTSMSMVLDYYHNSNSNLKTATADELVKMLDPGDGTSKGIYLNKLDDDLGELGYRSNVIPGNMDELNAKLKEGPVIVNVGVQLENFPRNIKQAGSTNHAMLVKAINTNSVVVNDPWSGSEKTFSRQIFENMWSNGENYMVIVRPQEK